MKRIFTLTLCTVLLNGCGSSTDSETCDEAELAAIPTHYRVTGLQLQALSYDGSDWWGNPTQLGNGSDVAANKFRLKIEGDAFRYFASKEKPSSFSIFSIAHACSPNSPQTDQQIESLQITSDAAYSSGYAAGTNLSALFEVLHADHRHDDEFSDTLAQYVEDKPDAAIDMHLKPLVDPDPGTHTFSITINYNDGTSYSATSVSVVLK